jgi:uracil-DNA glycosylase family 4
MTNNISTFNVNCTDCPRLSKYLKKVRKKYPEYHGKPVCSFGSTHPQLLVVGLAPGLHGANATGRPFTGDHAGILLYQMLYKYGFSNNPISRNMNDNLKLKDSRITNAVRCLPPQNKPLGDEIDNCNHYLGEELENIKQEAIVLCLGQIAHSSTFKALHLKQSDYPFKHGQFHRLDDGKIIVDSYHCSRYNTQTKRLTEAMFDDVFKNIKKQLEI